jgi:YHS domain-containing protein
MRAPLKLLLAALAALAMPATAAVAKAPAPQVSYAADKLAAGGYDVTAYFREGKPVRGSALHQFTYKGATWRFASARALASFKAEPSAFAPQFGGYGAWAVSQGYLAPGDPRQWKIVDGKFYLNFNARAKELWEADQADAIRRGHSNWPRVLTDNQDR